MEEGGVVYSTPLLCYFELEKIRILILDWLVSVPLPSCWAEMCEECGLKRQARCFQIVLYLSVPRDSRKRLEVTVGGRAADLGKVKGFKKRGTQKPGCSRASSNSLDLQPSSGYFFFGGVGEAEVRPKT